MAHTYAEPIWERDLPRPKDRPGSAPPRFIDSPLEANLGSCFLRLTGFGTGKVFLKLEGLNPAGSVKLRPAISMIERLERERSIRPGQHYIIESSSGNLGVALAVVCRVKGYGFTCVTDPNANPWSVKVMRAYGAEVIVVQERDEEGGYLGARIDRIYRMLEGDPRYVWTNQYANIANPGSHYAFTAPEIHEALPEVDYVFVGAGSTGTVIGCARYFARHRAGTKVIAVDTAGSVTFGGPKGPRFIPGLGTSRRPEIADLHDVNEVLSIPEEDAVLACRRLLDRYGLLAGGSTGSVLAAVERYPFPPESTVVAISADLGDRYVDTLYDHQWVAARFPSLRGKPDENLTAQAREQVASA
jgi:N-(2-amino-2-carboxyethyl)-L-glutamate synthase